MKKVLRNGITTGTCAAAAAKAAILSWKGIYSPEVTVLSPQGKSICVKISSCQPNINGGRAVVIKDAGDDPDVTNGVSIIAEVEILNNCQTITILGGEGVGIVTKPGLAVEVGQPAINPGPRHMITQAVQDVLPDNCGAVVKISIPGGEKLAQRTLNPILGIEGGLSIIGTTGIVEPMSEEAFKNSLIPQLGIIKALGYTDLVFVPGKIGQDIAIKRYALPEQAVAQTSNFVGHMLSSAVEYKFKRVLLFGHLGKIVKVAAGIFHTHNRVADARMETIAAYAALLGAPIQAVQEILSCATTEEAGLVVDKYEVSGIYSLLARRASERAMRYVFNDLVVGTVIVTLKGDILGLDENARDIGGSMGWNIR